MWKDVYENSVVPTVEGVSGHIKNSRIYQNLPLDLPRKAVEGYDNLIEGDNRAAKEYGRLLFTVGIGVLADIINNTRLDLAMYGYPEQLPPMGLFTSIGILGYLSIHVADAGLYLTHKYSKSETKP